VQCIIFLNIKHNSNIFEKIRFNQLNSLIYFVVKENLSRYKTDNPKLDFKSCVRKIYNEEKILFKDSNYYVLRSSEGSLLGSIRTLELKDDSNYILPIQNLFNIHPFDVIKKNFKSVFHIGRFAIKSNVQDISILKAFITLSIISVCNHPKNVAFAECDSKLLKTLNLIGINAKILGEPVTYLGSKTYPILLEYNGLIDFYNQNIEKQKRYLMHIYEPNSIRKNSEIKRSVK